MEPPWGIRHSLRYESASASEAASAPSTRILTFLFAIAFPSPFSRSETGTCPGSKKKPPGVSGGFTGHMLKCVPQYPFAGMTRIRFQGSRPKSPLSRIFPTPPLLCPLYGGGEVLSNRGQGRSKLCHMRRKIQVPRFPNEGSGIAGLASGYAYCNP